MEIRVHGKNMQVADGVRALADEKVRHSGRIFDDGGWADVEFSEANNPRQADERYRVEITTLMKGRTVRVEATAVDERAALDIAVDKFERRLRKLKERLIQRNRNQRAEAAAAAAAAAETTLVPDLNGSLTDLGDEDETDGEAPRTVTRTKRFELRPMSVEEAVLQMEMLGHDFFFFLHADSGDHSVLYHRKDGTLGLIQPS